MKFSLAGIAFLGAGSAVAATGTSSSSSSPSSNLHSSKENKPTVASLSLQITQLPVFTKPTHFPAIMKFSLAGIAFLGAGSAVAAPQPANAFNLMSLRSASPIHFGQFSAAKRGLYINYKDQNAKCKGKSDGHVTFYIKDGGLFLYSTCGETQQVFTDRSGMGQGVLGYLTGKQSPPRYGELTGWKIDANGNLNFKDAGLIACPNSVDGSWSVWVSVGIDQPGGNKNCLGLSARTLPNKAPVSCAYSQ